MSKFLNFFSKIEVSPISVIFIILTLITNSYKLFFIYFLITFIHELGHVIVALFLKLKINKIKLLAIGFNAEIDNLDYTSSIKELLVTIAGPLTYFITLPFLKYLYQISFISYNAYLQSLLINKYILIFNLLPIVPLDGGRILKIILDSFFTKKRAMIICSFLSNIFIILLIYKTLITPQWLMYVFLILNNIIYLLSISKKWKLFLINRLITQNKQKEKIHNHCDLYRNRYNYLIMNKKIFNEETAIREILANNVANATKNKLNR